MINLPNEVKRPSHLWNIIHGEKEGGGLKKSSHCWWINITELVAKTKQNHLSREAPKLGRSVWAMIKNEK